MDDAKIVVVACPGESLSAAQIARCEPAPIIAVTEAHEIVPNPAAIVAMDSWWWLSNADVLHKKAPKFSVSRISNVTHIRSRVLDPSTNSGVLGLEVARQIFGATHIVLLGADLCGGRFNGTYSQRPPSDWTWEVFKKQYKRWADAFPNIRVFNCSPYSELELFPRRDLGSILAC